MSNATANEVELPAVTNEEDTLDIEDEDVSFPDIEVDPEQEYKATELKILSCVKPHMIAFHIAWIGFFMAFLAWFAVAPLLPVIKKDLKLSKNDIFDSNIASVTATVLTRFIVGPLCDTFGARRIFAALLVIGAVPTFFLGTIKTATDLIIIRLFIGIIGGAFVCTQHWTSCMFAKNVVGTANATAGGWGNLGGGVTQIFMIGIWLAISKATDEEQAWRISFVVPAALTLLAAGAVYFLAQDTPLGDQVAAKLPKEAHVNSRERAKSLDSNDGERRLSYTSEEIQESLNQSMLSSMGIWSNSAAWILFLHYAMCFGVELTMNNVAATYFVNKYDLTPATAGGIASLFGLMNLFARSLGGILSDYAFNNYGMAGRLWTQMFTMIFEGGFMLVFSRMINLSGSIAALIFFSVMVQMSEGSTYSLVPSVKPSEKGAVSGIVGAGGNVGAVAWGMLFRFGGNTMDKNFETIGIIVIISSLLTPFLRLEGYGEWEILNIRSNQKGDPVPKSLEEVSMDVGA